MMSLLKMSPDKLEELIGKLLIERLDGNSLDEVEDRFFVINEDTILIKLFVQQQLIFTIKAKLIGEHLEVVDVS